MSGCGSTAPGFYAVGDVNEIPLAQPSMMEALMATLRKLGEGTLGARIQFLHRSFHSVRKASAKIGKSSLYPAVPESAMVIVT
jgi:hypothetical protein